jgi:hypothetical protein
MIGSEILRQHRLAVCGSFDIKLDSFAENVSTTSSRTHNPIEERMMEDREIRQALERHWNASNANDFETEHAIYCDDAVSNIPNLATGLADRSMTADQAGR